MIAVGERKGTYRIGSDQEKGDSNHHNTSREHLGCAGVEVEIWGGRYRCSLCGGHPYRNTGDVSNGFGPLSTFVALV
eukprot:2185338-Rhodomonas_salina.3